MKKLILVATSNPKNASISTGKLLFCFLFFASFLLTSCAEGGGGSSSNPSIELVEIVEGADFTTNFNATADVLIKIDWRIEISGTARFDDFSSPNGEITIEAGSNSLTIPSITQADDIVEPDETFAILIDNIRIYTITEAGEQTVDIASSARYSSQRIPVKILNDDLIEVDFFPNPLSINEGTTIDVNLTITKERAIPVSFTLSFSPTGVNRASVGRDYTFPGNSFPKTIRMEPSQNNYTISISTINNNVVEADKTFEILIDNIKIYTSNSRGQIVDTAASARNSSQIIPAKIVNDDQIKVSFSPSSLSIDEGENSNVTLTITGVKAIPVNLTLSANPTGDNPALVGRDYTFPGNSFPETILIEPSQDTYTREITINSVENTIHEGDKQFLFIVSSNENYFDATSLLVRIIEDDPPIFSNEPIIREGEDLTLSGITTDVLIQFEWSIINEGHSASLEDFQTTTGDAEIAVGENSVTISNIATNDSIVEADETFEILVDNIRIYKITDGGEQTVDTVVSARYSSQRIPVKILNDDQVGISVPSSFSITEGESRNITLTITETRAIPVNLTLSANPTGDNPALAGDYFFPKTIRINPSQNTYTIAINTTNDNIVDADKTFEILIANTKIYKITDAGEQTVDTVASARHSSPRTLIKILNTNQIRVIFSPIPLNILEGEDSSVTLTITGVRAIPVSLILLASPIGNNPALAGDYTFPGNSFPETILIEPQDTYTREIAISSVENTIYEGDKQFLFVVSSDANYFDTTSLQISIIEDESPIFSDELNIREGEDLIIPGVTADVLIQFEWRVVIGEGYSANSEDFQTTTGSAEITVGENNVTISNITVNDSILELDETFEILIDNVRIYTTTGAGEQTIDTIASARYSSQRIPVKILNDDQIRISVSPRSLSITEGENSDIIITITGARAIPVDLTLSASSIGSIPALPGDYNFPVAIRIAASQTTTDEKRVNIQTVENGVTEGDKQILLVITPNENYFDATSLQISIIEDDDATVDGDGDGLIDIYTLTELHNMRNNLAGTNYTDETGVTNDIGCPSSGCIGYELMRDLTFDIDGDGSSWELIGGSYVLDAEDSRAPYFVVSSKGWLPIGDYERPFNAILEGNGKTISHLATQRNCGISLGTTNFGMFGSIGGRAKIRNLHLKNALINCVGNALYIGGLVGLQQENSLIRNSSVTGVLTGSLGTDNFLGGFAGLSFGNIVASSSDVDIIVDKPITTSNGSGGLVGLLASPGKIIASSAAGDITGINLTSGAYIWGGLVGQQSGGSLIASYATGNIRVEGPAPNNALGGVIGSNFGFY